MVNGRVREPDAEAALVLEALDLVLDVFDFLDDAEVVRGTGVPFPDVARAVLARRTIPRRRLRHQE